MKKIIIFILITIVHYGYSQDQVLTPDDIAKLKMVTIAVISENGDKVAYLQMVQANPKEENAPASMHLYIYDVNTKTSTPFITQYSVRGLNFRPKHNTLTFLAKRENDKATSLYEIALTGGEAQKLYEFKSSISDYSWHPTGHKIAFVAQKPEDKGKNRLPYQPEVYEENLKSSMAFIADLNSKEAKEVAVKGHANHIQWNPDGSLLAVSAAPSPLVDDFYTSQKIYIVDANNLNVKAEVDHKAKLGTFKWGPDGKKIALIGGEDQHDPIEGRLLIANATGGKAEILQKDFKGSFDDFAWRDNNTIVFLASEGVYSSIGTITTNGKMDKFYDNKNMAISGISRANSNLIAFVSSTPQHPNELFLLKSGSQNAERITNSNSWLAEKKMGKQEVVTYKAKDGLEIQGIFIHPVNPANKNPMITVVHGGPEAHYDNGWLTAYSMPGQMGAGQGYAVFYPNYRGSTGRGLEFAKSSQGDPAGKEFDDIIDGIDYLIENKNVDRSKVGVTGGSYGGYATAWMSTRHTERFAAGVMFVGISNNLSKWGTSDIPEEMFLVHSRKRIWDDYEFFLDRSPIKYAGQAKTPLLIMHGKEDTRVSPGQSYELYRHIKTRTDTPVRLVLYPGEGHGNRKSTARYDYSLRMMRWFDTYLKNSDNKIPETKVSIETGE